MTSGSASDTSGTTRTDKHDPLCGYRPDVAVDYGVWDRGAPCRCGLIAKVRTDERSRWNTPYFSVEYHRGYRQAQQDERQRWVETITSRIEDLRSCGKDDDCETKADGAELALDDGLYVSHAQTFPTPPAPPAAQPKNGDPRVSYAQGYLDALEATSWTCLDCGNTYDPDITECPNRHLDEAKVALRTAERRAGA